MYKLIIGVLAIFIWLPVSGCESGSKGAASRGQSQDAPAYNHVKSLDEFDQNGARVTFAIEEDLASQTYLTGKFTPMESGYYFYGNELPMGGIQGLGVPTRMDLHSNTDIATNGGDVIVDQASFILKIETLDVELPVYEPGPVTLRIPVNIEGRDGVATEVRVSYMMCRKSDGVCLPPVRNKPVMLSL